MRFPIVVPVLFLALAAGARPVPAQTSDSGAVAADSDTVLARAQQLVSEGRGDEGRALVEARLRQAAPGSPEYVRALYWRAALATTAAAAERDLQRIVIEYPLAPHADDALLRLAQLELARGDRAGARKHLERLALEYPSGAARVRGGIVLARTYFDDRLFAKGCAALDDVMLALPASDVEQRNQVDYMRQRCVGIPRGDGATVAAGAPGMASGQGEGTAASRDAGVAASAGAGAAPGAAPGAAARAGGPPPTSTSPRPAAAASPERRAAERPAARATAQKWSVQVAAFRGKAEAEALRKRLAALGWPARVSHSGSLHRVRVGRYATRADAQGAIARMKKQHVDGIVVEAERE